MTASATHLMQPMLATCKACEHVWPIMWLPVPIGLVSKFTPKACPACHQTQGKKIVMASRTAGDLDRYVAWLSRELFRAREEAASPTEAAPAPPPDGI